MSENNQNNRPAQGGEKKEQSNGERAGRNHRHRRPHHRGPRPQQSAEQRNAEQRTEGDVATPNVEKKETRGEESAKKQQNQSRGGQGNRHGRGQNNHKDKNRGGKGNRYGLEKRPFDPYEQPSRQEIELSELRAQIVIKAADGSVPTAYSSAPTAPVAPAAPTTPVPPAELASTAPVDFLEEATPTGDEPLTPAPDTVEEAGEEEERVEVIGVRFRASGKTYYFDPHGIRAKKGDYAIVETTRGPEFGEVGLANTMVKASSVVAPLRPILRIATKEDIAHNAENREREGQALKICQEKVAAHKLEMKLIDVQYAFDNSKLLFYFAADGRVDFRELVKDLASVFRTRIELRQIGIRDEAKMLGGIGACGRTLCCSTFLPDFAQVSIKMAKDQNLSLNANKISGVCGRLMCCLRYESEVYAEEIRKTPSHDSTVRTPDGVGTVIGSNPLAGTVRVLLKDTPDTPPKQYHRDEVTLLPKERRTAPDRAKGEKKDGES